MRAAVTLIVLASLIACRKPPGAAEPNGTSPPAYATIEFAPPTPLPPERPPFVPPKDGLTLAEQGAFQNRVLGKMSALHKQLKREPQYVDMRLDWEYTPPRVVYSFTRDADATLARYSTDPDFIAETVKYTQAEIESKFAEAQTKLAEMGLSVMGGGTGSATNRAIIDLGMSREALLTHNGAAELLSDDAYQFNFIPDAVIDPIEPISEAAKPLIRYFPRLPKPKQVSLFKTDIGNGVHAIVLRDGCFFVDLVNANDPLAVFEHFMGVKTDAEGHVLLYPRAGSEGDFFKSRVGDMSTWHGGAQPYEDVSGFTNIGDLTPLFAACGKHPVMFLSDFENWRGYETQILRRYNRFNETRLACLDRSVSIRQLNRRGEDPGEPGCDWH